VNKALPTRGVIKRPRRGEITCENEQRVMQPSKLYWGAIANMLLGMFVFTPFTAAATEIKVGLLRSIQNGAIFVAQEKGYFAEDGLATELVFYSTAQQIPAAVASRTVDFGAAGTTTSLFRSGLQGTLRIIGGVARETAGYRLYGLAVSPRAYEAGLKTFKDLPGHSVAVATLGAPAHYGLALIAGRYGFPLTDVRLFPEPAYTSIVAAVSRGQADAGIIPATAMLAEMSRGALRVIGWIGDEAPWQVSVVFTGSALGNEKRETVLRFLRAYRRGARAYYDAFTAPDGSRKDGSTAPEILSIVARYIGQRGEQIRAGIAYVDPDAHLDVRDILRQIEWYRKEGLVDVAQVAESIIDDRYVIPLPQR
jgi:NitT/TauT family transport system substrate-binding protein